MIKGLICPVDEQRYTFAECLACAEGQEQCSKDKKKCHFTLAILRVIARETEEERTGYHVTGITGCLRSTYYNWFIDVYPEIISLFYFFRGRAFHMRLEVSEEGDRVSGLEIESDMNGQLPAVLKGRINEISFSKGIIRDYESCEKVPTWANAYANHSLQLNLYLYLLQTCSRWTWGWGPQKMETIYLSMSQPKKCKIIIKDFASVDTFVKRCMIILEHASAAKKPPLKQIKDLWNCNYCFYKEQCEKDYIKEIREGSYDDIIK